MEETKDRTVFDVVSEICRNYDYHVSNIATCALERFTHEQFDGSLEDLTENEFFASYGRDAEDIVMEELFDSYGEENLAQYKIPEPQEAPQFWVGPQDAIDLAKLILDYRDFDNAAQARIDEGNLEDAELNAKTAAYLECRYVTLAKKIIDAKDHGRVLDYVTPKNMIETV